MIDIFSVPSDAIYMYFNQKKCDYWQLYRGEIGLVTLILFWLNQKKLCNEALVISIGISYV